MPSGAAEGAISRAFLLCAYEDRQARWPDRYKGGRADVRASPPLAPGRISGEPGAHRSGSLGGRQGTQADEPAHLAAELLAQPRPLSVIVMMRGPKIILRLGPILTEPTSE